MPSTPSSKPGSTISAEPDEQTPLLQQENVSHAKTSRSRLYRILFTSFLVSLSFGVTQVPILYIVGLMTCDEYYKTHQDTGQANKCHLPIIDADTSKAIALLGVSNTFFGVINLFVVGWIIKAMSIKTALITTVFCPSIRLLIQNVGVDYGGGFGIVILQLSQIISLIGGPAGYLLALNAYATEVVEPAERTGALGRLQGCAMFGTSVGFLAGGLIGDVFDIKTPFRVTFALFSLSTLYCFICLPEVGHLDEAAKAKASKNLSAFIDPIKMFVPTKWTLKGGQVRREYGVLLLGIGIFFGVLATAFIPTLLQLYATDVFDFGTKENGWLISMNSAIRGIFLTFAFPPIIKYGRRWMHDGHQNKPTVSEESDIPDGSGNTVITEQVAPAAAQSGEPEPVKTPRADSDESHHFDLFFTRWSLLLDGALTSLAGLLTDGWQLYLIGAVLPLASGTGSAAKGTILQMCPPEQRTDALSAISLLELVARLTTTAVFGVIFAAFANIGKTNLVFPCNGAIALLGFIVLLFAHFPPHGAERYTKSGDDHESSLSQS